MKGHLMACVMSEVSINPDVLCPNVSGVKCFRFQIVKSLLDEVWFCENESAKL